MLSSRHSLANRKYTKMSNVVNVTKCNLDLGRVTRTDTADTMSPSGRLLRRLFRTERRWMEGSVLEDIWSFFPKDQTPRASGRTGDRQVGATIGSIQNSFTELLGHSQAKTRPALPLCEPLREPNS